MEVDRYLKVARWAQSRYAKNGWLTVSVGARLTQYSLIERAAWLRYMA